ncbi:MAG: HlyD family efflux transporter periplasmic adaptor subunit [Spirochaetaceae bacterium]|nr:HlyD family efflux transporter periplasmic adaptor subunit [Spirochaetaceae bacterium]
MKKIFVVKHQNKMKYTQEFIQLKIPREVFIMLYSIIIFFIVCLCILIFGNIDDVIKVSGIVRTKDNISNVTNIISGKIIELNYKPGQKVNKGDVLYKLDPSIYNAQKENLLTENETLSEKINNIEILIESYYAEKFIGDIIKNDYAFIRFNSYLQTLNEYEVQKKIAKYNYDLEISKTEYLKNLNVVQQNKFSLESIDSNIKRFKANFLQELFSEKEELNVLFKKNEQDILKLNSQFEFLTIKSIHSGYVQEVSSLNIGDYIEAGKTVLNIIPNDFENFRIELIIPPKDMGKLQVGLKVKYRLSAFPFFEYKGANGEIISIDPDSRVNSSGNRYYCVYANIDRTTFENRKGESFSIRSGLETDARIVLKNSSILFYILRKMDLLW